MTTTAIVMLVTALFILLAMLIIGLIGTRTNGNILLGVSLPNHALEDEAVLGIVKMYTRVYLLHALLCALLAVPIGFITREDVAAFYFMFWFLLTLFLLLRLIERYFNRLYELKVANQWWVGAEGSVAVDLAVSRVKHTFMASAWCFLLPFGVCITLLVVDIAGGVAPFWPILGLCMVALYFLVYCLISRIKTKTYSEDTSVNLQLNHVFKRMWSCCVIVLAMISCVYAALPYVAAGADEDVIWLVAALLFSTASLVAVVLTHDRIKAWRNRLLRPIQPINKDEDQYWIGGIFYNNPNDANIFVEKRIGIGFTMNIGILPGKLLLVGGIIFVIAAFVLPFWL